MRIIKLNEETKKNIMSELIKRDPNQYQSYEAVVKDILDNVKLNGNKALFEYTKKFDGFDLSESNMVITREEIDEAYSILDPELVATMKKAMENIRAFHEKQLMESWFTSRPDGSILGQKISALDSVGVYVPGGKAAYPSSVLMNIVPAHVAGVRRIVMTTPCNK